MTFLPAGKKKKPSISEKAFHGLAGEFCRFHEGKTEADTAAILAQYLTLFGNIIGRSAYFSVESDRHYAKIFTVIVGTSAKARKGTSLVHAKKTFSLTDPDWVRTCIKSGLSSGEGLIHQLRDEEPIEEHSSVMRATDIDKRLVVEETEFASVLRNTQRSGNTLSVFIRKSWDNDTLQTLTKNSTERASNSHVSIIGHITIDELVRLLNATETANGFGNRILWIYAERKIELPLGAKIDEEFLNFQSANLGRCIQFAQKQGEVMRSKAADEFWMVIYSDLSKERFGILGSLLARAEPYVMRLSLIYAMLAQSKTIEPEHIEAAKALWDYSVETCEYIFGGKFGYPDADKITEFFLQNPQGVSRSKISEVVFGKNRNSSEIDKALEFLKNQGIADCQVLATEGRGKEIWTLRKASVIG